MERSADREDLIEALVADYLGRLDAAGPDRAEAVLREHAELAEPVRARVQGLMQMGLLGERVPERLGRYRVLGILGQGTMGVVYRAHDEHLGREVALKAIRPENLFFPEARERFRREVEIVASLRHRHIVPVLEVGEEQGLPFFAMERIEGVSLAAALAAVPGRDLDATVGSAGRFGGPWAQVCVRILAEVAEAVGHAHARGVVHRDLKPANILLARDGRALLTDFGLGRAEGTPARSLTRGSVGSLDYLAPELLRPDPPKQGPRQDVFALGMTLYQMLTVSGRQPLAGDVETVCVMAMDPDPQRRYATGAEMAADLRAVLALQPIQARRPGAVLRLRRWTRQHPTLAVASVLGFFLVVVAPTLGWMANRAAFAAVERERDVSRMVLEFQAALVAEADPARNGGRDLTLREALDLVLPRYGVRMAQEPRTASVVLAAAAQVYLGLGRPEQAQAQFRRALAAQEQIPDREHATAAQLQCSIAQCLAMAHRFDESHATMDRAESFARAKCGAGSAALATTLVVKGQILNDDYKWRASIPAFEAALAILASHPDRIEARIQAQIGLASAWRWWHQRFRNSRSLLAAALEAATRWQGPESRWVQSATRELASLELVVGEWDRAAQLGRQALELARTLYRHDDHPQVALANNDLGLILRDSNRPVEAEPHLRACLAAHRHVAAGDSSVLIDKRINLALVLGEMGRFGEAEALLQEALLMARTALPPADGNPHHLEYGCQEQLARLYLATGDVDRAQQLLIESVERYRPADHFCWCLGWHLGLLADIARGRGQAVEAEALYRDCLEAMFPGVQGDVLYRRLNNGSSIFARNQESLRGLLRARGDEVGLQALEQDCERRLRAQLVERDGQPASVETGFLLRLLGTTLIRLGRPEEARPYLTRALAMIEAEASPNHCEAREARTWLAKAGAARK